MFKLVDETRAWWPVAWPGVTEDGDVIENRIELQFRVLDTDAVAELEADGTALDERIAALGRSRFTLEAKPDLPISRSDLLAEFLGRIAVDWRGVAAANGEAMAFCQDALVRLMKVNGVFEAALRAYRNCLAGRAEVRSGN